ncbi:MAG: cell division protein [Salinibacterium sp.]|nr:cell division protein [Salinibacterium sp.]
MSSPASRRITAPRPPEAPAPFRFPVIASLAPLVAAVALWLMTGSPFALLFAVLGPVTAVASFADSKFGARKSNRRELARFALDARATVARIELGHAAERAELAELGPAAHAIVERRGADPYRWTASGASPILVSVGIGGVDSAIRLEGAARGSGSAADDELDEIDRLASVIADSPVLVDARLGIGICGTPALATAVARAIAVQLAWALSPAGFWVAGSATEASWIEALPHTVERPARAGCVAEFGELGTQRATALVAVAARQSELPGECRVVIRVGDDRPAEIVQHPDRTRRRQLSCTLLSRESAIAWADRACQDAARDGLVSSGRDIPDTVALRPLLRASHADLDVGTAVEFAVDATGPVTIDLVAHGPHAVVGGTTGSGKSELLISWVVALAAANPPEALNFLLMDFKGGSAFDSLALLPHTVGIITDLDATQAARALSSLRAELKYRERVLAAAGARDIRQLPPDGVGSMPRLVIVADEFAAMLADHPDLHPLFADIASRGRSLGVHLILCTQRPAGIVRDGVLANTDLRISLRVNNTADSSAVIGSDIAASLPVAAVGRGVIALAGADPVLAQFAIAGPADAEDVALRWHGSAEQRRPWCEPLPPTVSRGELAETPGDVAFGLTDLPHEQRRSTAHWNGRRDGHVLVLGASHSGKSTALAVIARGGLLIPEDVAGAWDALEALESAGDTSIAIDDLDSLLSRFPAEYRDTFVERLSRLLRDGPGRGLSFVLAAQRLTVDVNPLAGLIPSRLMLRHSSKADFVLAGGDGAGFDATLPQGGGIWRGDRVQVASDPAAVGLATTGATAEPDRTRPWAIVTSRVASLGARLATAGFEVQLLDELGAVPAEAQVSAGAVLLGDIEQWQSRWGLLPTLRTRAEIMFDGCSIADYRALTRSRQLPPPLTGLPATVWLERDTGAVRAQLVLEPR